MSEPLPLAISVGDPAGIGPVVTVRALTELQASIPAVCFGDAAWLRRLFVAHGWVRDALVPWPDRMPRAGQVGLAHAAEWSAGMVAARAPTRDGGLAQRLALDMAADQVRAGQLSALVTGPISKAAVSLSGISFSGQTEHVAERLGCVRDGVTMVFIGPRLAVALVTTHLAVRHVPNAITAARIERSVRHLCQVLGRLDRGGVIEVAGLNPHAGEGGLLGREEQDVIAPVVGALRPEIRRDRRFELVGPSASEAAFRRAAAGTTAGVVAMLHDQATIASKLLDFGRAVNVTWGLPIVRTSVDHGVAYEAARGLPLEPDEVTPRVGAIDHGGMLAAVALASRFASAANRHPVRKSTC